MKVVMSILEARTQTELQSKARAQEKGLHAESYFNFNLFVEQYFAAHMPQQLKREKYVFNFLWNLLFTEERNQLLEIFIELLKGSYQLADLQNCLMIKDFVKQHLVQKAKLNFVDLAEQGPKFEHSDSLILLVRHIVLNYDAEFKPMLEEKFLVLKGDIDYITLFDFIGITTIAFRELRLEGITPRLRTVYLQSPPKASPYNHDHLLRCYGMTGLIQDRTKTSKDDLKWYLWSDYPAKSARQREISSKEVGDFFAIDMDKKVQEMKERSAQKGSKRACSPIPYKNLTERTKGVIEELNLDVPGRVSKHATSGRGHFMDRHTTQSDLDELSKKFRPSRDHELLVFERFDRMPHNEALYDRSVMQAVSDYDAVQRKAADLRRSMQLEAKPDSRVVGFIRDELMARMSRAANQ